MSLLFYSHFGDRSITSSGLPLMCFAFLQGNQAWEDEVLLKPNKERDLGKDPFTGWVVYCAGNHSRRKTIPPSVPQLIGAPQSPKRGSGAFLAASVPLGSAHCPLPDCPLPSTVALSGWLPYPCGEMAFLAVSSAPWGLWHVPSSHC